jgi:hypothetical protein
MNENRKKKLSKCLTTVWVIQVSAVLRAKTMKFSIVNEIKLTYSRKGNSEKTVLSSRDASNILTPIRSITKSRFTRCILIRPIKS